MASLACESHTAIQLWGRGYSELTDSWDALGPSFANAGDDEDDTSGRVWRVQAHAKNSITCMKVDPVAGSSVSLPRRLSTPKADRSCTPRRMTVHSVGWTSRRASQPRRSHLTTTTC